MTSTSQSFNYSHDDTPKTPTKTESQSFFASPGSDKGERLTFSSPTQGWNEHPSPSAAPVFYSPPPANMISPPHNIFDNSHSHAMQNMLTPRFGYTPGVGADSSEHHMQSPPFAPFGGASTHSVLMNFASDDHDALDSSNRPLKRQRIEYPNGMSDASPVQMYGMQHMAMHQMHQHHVYLPSMSSMQFVQPQPQMAYDSMHNTGEPGGARRKLFNTNGTPTHQMPLDGFSAAQGQTSTYVSSPAQLNPSNVPILPEPLPVGDVNDMGDENVASQDKGVELPPLNSRAPAPRKSNNKRKKKRKRKGHTIVDDVTGMKSGTWTDDEHDRFLEALNLYKKGNWKDIARHVGTRTRVQCASHAQKYEIRLQRERDDDEEVDD